MPLAWFLFNVDFLSEDDKVYMFEEDVDDEATATVGYATRICARLTRDDQSRITAMTIPGCGVINFGYHDTENDGMVVDIVDTSALSCIADPKATPVC